MQARESRQRSTDCNGALHSSQRCAETVMDALAECQMVIRLASYVERVGVGKMFGVAICCGNHDERDRICLQLHTIDRNINLGIPRSGLDWAIVSQHLLDRAWHQLGCASQV